MTRRVRRHYTQATRTRIPFAEMVINSNIDTDIRTLTKRAAALKPGESLYPWALTRLSIANGKRRWVAKDSHES